jgi:HEAT repeat protein
VRGLLLLLRDPDPEARVRAVTALGDLGGQAHWALPVLRCALKQAALSDEEPVRTRALRALLQAGPQPDSEVAALVDSLRDELDVVRFHAAAALGDLGGAARPAVAPLTHAALWDEEPAVRVQAAAALWKVDRNKVPLVLQVLTQALAEDSELVCWVAADWLGQIGPEAREAVPALRQALRRPFKIALIRKGVALALRRIDPQAAFEAGAG